MSLDPSDSLELVGAPGFWDVRVIGDRVLNVAAHAFSEENDTYAFSLFISGRPGWLLRVLTVPKTLVREIFSHEDSSETPFEFDPEKSLQDRLREMGNDPIVRLTSSPAYWGIRFVSGEEMQVAAHRHTKQGDLLCFWIATEGGGQSDVLELDVPASLVESVSRIDLWQEDG